MEEREALKQTVVEPEGQEAEPADAMAAIDKIIERVQESLFREDVKPSVADLMRLLELRRELAQLQPGPVTVRWIDECQQTPACEE